MKDLECEIAIVGGGPAGSTLALSLARERGIDPSDVILLEKEAHPREKPCAGAISAFGVAALKELGVAIDVPFAPMEGVRVLRGQERAAVREPLGAVVRRDEFDAMLFRLAEREGVRTLEREPLASLERGADAFVLRTPARTVRARLLAGCDGAGSATRKRLGLREPARKGHLYVTETAQRSGDDGVREGLCDFDFGPTLSGLEGYYWDFPIVLGGERCVSRGIYHANLSPSREVKAVLARHLEQRGLRASDVELKPFSTRPFVRQTALAGDGWVLVGEAAGIDATTGEGIAQAIAFGRVASKHLAAALRTGSRALSAYAGEVRSSVFGRHLLQSARLAPHVYGPRSGAFQELLLRSERARRAAARWYVGQPVGALTLARLAVELAWRGAR